MPADPRPPAIAAFDLGGTWFRGGCYSPDSGLTHCWREPAINYLNHPDCSAAQLQAELADFIVTRLRKLCGISQVPIHAAGVSIGAPVNAHDMRVLGSGPLWGPSAEPFDLHGRLNQALPAIRWHIVNDITALLAPYMERDSQYGKTMLVTVSSGIGSRLYDHRADCIPFDPVHGVQGEIGHLICPFELEGRLISSRCECGGLNHVNAFCSGRGIAITLRELPELSANFNTFCSDSPDDWRRAGEPYRLGIFRTALDAGNETALALLGALVTPLCRILATALTLDPRIDRIVMTGGVVHGLGEHYREAVQRRFLADALYKITDDDPRYLANRLHWEAADDFSGLRGAALYVLRTDPEPAGESPTALRPVPSPHDSHPDHSRPTPRGKPYELTH